MASRAVATTITYRAWDTSANAAKTGDSANHTLRWIKDGTASAPTNSPAEVDSVNAPGVYKLALTSTETDCVCGTLAGKSSTANVSIIGAQFAFDYAAAAAFPTNFGSLSIDGSGRVDVAKVAGTAQTAADVGAIFAANGVETGYALKDALRLIFSALCAKVSGLPGSPVFRDVPDTKARITATTDSNGNRSAVTLDAT